MTLAVALLQPFIYIMYGCQPAGMSLFPFLLNTHINWQSDQCNSNARQRHDSASAAGEEKLAYNDEDPAPDGKNGDHGIARHFIGPLCFWMGAAHVDYAGKGEGIEDPTGEGTHVCQQVKLPDQGIERRESAHQNDGICRDELYVQL